MLEQCLGQLGRACRLPWSVGRGEADAAAVKSTGTSRATERYVPIRKEALS